ncbi:MAG: enoyl-CoA hydratase/isomerase family protein [Sphingomonas sp.]|uniref:enoyl-CoA hydratase-related protein n=1 Tax=Sphingomonas sp. TaxID=28214 RepID=UPI0025F37E8E|nr:enoyl-CoA hydratase-related protein [Sphingomonas sp.]MBX3563530.1 enoyl-CoA hydratase/isomerase family protein [Sphingomonas sp.]
MAQGTAHILVEHRRTGCVWISFNHPERLNAFDGDTCLELAAAIEEASANPEIGVIILSGVGDKAFCTGGYLGELTSFNPEKARHLFGSAMKALEAIRSAPQPVIAAINGYAVGGGNEFVVACDLAIASDKAKLGQTGPRIGSSPVFGATNLFAMSVGEKRAKEICMLCRQYTAAQALEMGWINAVVPHEQLEAEVDRWVDELLAKSPAYLEVTKISSNVWWDMMRPHFNHAGQALMRMAGHPEMIEGATAFMEKRPPDFQQFRTRRGK